MGTVAHPKCMNCNGSGMVREADPEGGFGFERPCHGFAPDTEVYYQG